MSILSDYEKIKNDIGEEEWNAIGKYLETQRPDLRLDQILYNYENWISFEKWFYQNKNLVVNVIDVWAFENNEYRASVEIGEKDEIYGTIIASCTEKEIRNLVGNFNGELTTQDLKNTFEISVLRSFESYVAMQNISKVSDLLREIYDTVKSSDGNMCFITYDDWKECFAEDYSNNDINNLKEEIKKYELENIIIFDQDDCKIIGYADLEKVFIDDRKEPIKEITTLEFLEEEKAMILHNISCYYDGRYISKAKKGYEKQKNNKSKEYER